LKHNYYGGFFVKKLLVFILTVSLVMGITPAFEVFGATLIDEKFDLSTDFPTGWVSTRLTGTTAVWSVTNAPTSPSCKAYSEPNCLKFNSYNASSTQSARLTMPAITVPTGDMAVVSFYMYHDTGYSSNNDRIQVQYSTDNGITWTSAGSAISRYASPAGWKQHTVSIKPQGVNVIIGFLGISEYGYNIYVDDISVSNASYIPVTD